MYPPFKKLIRQSGWTGANPVPVITLSGDGYRTTGEHRDQHHNCQEELAAKAIDSIQNWMESGHSQLLSREQALQVAAWGLKIAGERELQHQVLAELVELPENYG